MGHFKIFADMKKQNCKHLKNYNNYTKFLPN